MKTPTIVEVGPRDGFQVVKPFIPTQKKIEICQALIKAGVTRLEAGAFVSPTAIPQMRDIREVLSALGAQPHVELSVLVPNRRGAEDALEAGIDALVYVVSASDAHSKSNVRRSSAEAMAEMLGVLSELRPSGRFRFNIATAFHCPFEGPTPHQVVLDMIGRVVEVRPDAEIGLCDTTGYASPPDVTALVQAVRRSFGDRVTLAYHAHDTYGFGVASVMAAWDAGVTIFDAAVAGLGGCPFAPGATGNVATEDVVYAFARRGIAVGIDLPQLFAAAESVELLEGADTGGHLRKMRRGRKSAGLRAKIWQDPHIQ